MLPPGRFANVELKFPSLRAVARYTPDFQRAEFVDASLKPHGHNRALLAIHIEGDLHGTEFLNLASPIIQQGAGVILFADGGAEESKLHRFTNDETELTVRNGGFRPFLHAEGDDAECFERSFHAGDRGHRALNSNVITAGSTTANAYTVTSTRFAVIGCPSRYRVLQVGCFQYLFW